MDRPAPPTVLRFLSHLGRDVAGYGALATRTLSDLARLRRPAIRRVLYKQIYFTGIEALFPVTLVGLMVGLAVITQMSNALGSGVGINVRAIRLLVVGELANLFTALIVLARSGSAIASELASMKQKGEVRLLYTMGIDPGHYLILPRVLGVCVSTFVLTFFFQFMATVGGITAASALFQYSFSTYFTAMADSIGWRDVVGSMCKSVLYGGIIATICCHHGIYAGRSAAVIPRCTETAMIRSLGMLCLADAGFAVLTV